MQLSQLYRRGVLRPLDQSASAQLAAFRIDNSIRVEWLPVLSDEHFLEIWEAGVLQQISQLCKVEISDYEETELRAERLELAIEVLRRTKAKIVFFSHLESLLVDADKNGSSVYFIF